MTGRQYTARWDVATAVSTVLDIFEILPADDKPVFLDELTVWQTSDLSDVQEEVIEIQVINGYTTSGSGGVAATVGRLHPGEVAPSFTAEARNTTIATTGTPYILHADGWNIRAPYIWTPKPDWEPWGSQAAPLYVRLSAAPSDAITMNAFIKIREMG